MVWQIFWKTFGVWVTLSVKPSLKIRANIESIVKSSVQKEKWNSESLQQDFKSIILELFFIQASHSVATNEAARDIRLTNLWTETSVKQWYSFTALKHTEPFVPEPICTPIRILPNLSVINLSSNIYIMYIVFIKSDV